MIPPNSGVELKLRELRSADRHELAFVQNDSPSPTQKLPPLPCRADRDQEHEHEKENSDQRVEPPDACLPHQISGPGRIGNSGRLVQK